MELLQIREKCKECKGQGVIENPIWTEFFEEEEKFKKDNSGERMSMAQCKEWFHSRGRTKLPREELTCAECGGEGITHKWIDINELASIIKAINL